MKLFRSINNAWIDLRIQHRLLRGTIQSKYLANGIKDVTNSSYSTIDFAFKVMQLKDNDIVVDVGCGKGRVFNQLLYKGCDQKMIGYEYDLEVARETGKRLSKYENVQIISGDIFDRFPYEGTVFYLFNPFDERLTQKFAIEILKCNNLANVRIFYFFPTNGRVFQSSDKFDCIGLSCIDYSKTDALLVKISSQHV